jgi:hypothetical protein
MENYESEAHGFPYNGKNLCANGEFFTSAFVYWRITAK